MLYSRKSKLRPTTLKETKRDKLKEKQSNEAARALLKGMEWQTDTQQFFTFDCTYRPCLLKIKVETSQKAWPWVPPFRAQQSVSVTSWTKPEWVAKVLHVGMTWASVSVLVIATGKEPTNAKMRGKSIMYRCVYIYIYRCVMSQRFSALYQKRANQC